jgi:hypothetical protein
MAERSTPARGKQFPQYQSGYQADPKGPAKRPDLGYETFKGIMA